MYVPSNTEIIVSNLLEEKGITSIFKLHICDFMKAFNITLRLCDFGGVLLKNERRTVIILNKNDPEVIQYESFLHELSHHIREDLSYQLVEEWQHNNFECKTNHLMQYIAMPYFLYEDIICLNTVEKVARYFHVTKELARKRLEGIKNKLIDLRGGKIANLQRQKREMVLSNQLQRHQWQL